MSPTTRTTFVVVAVLSLFVTAASGCSGCRHDKANAVADDGGVPDAAMTIDLAPPGASSLAPMASGSLTKFFPKDGAGGYARVFSGEKQGYAEAKLQKDGKEVALVSITDASRLAFTKARYEGVTEKVGDVPVLKVSDKETTGLVKDRFQVKVFSTSLDHEARKVILASFDLAGLGS